MAYDRPQVPQPTANYPAHSHSAMHKQAMDGNDPGLAGEIAAEWKSISTELIDVAVGLNTVVNGLRAGWTGTAGAAASQALTKVGNFTDQLSTSFSTTSNVINRQVEAAEATKNKFPTEVPYNPQQMLRDSAASLNPFKMAAAPFEMMAQREKSQAAKQEAERVMQERDNSLAAAAATMPTFDEAPQLPNGDQGVTTSSSTTFGHTTNSVNPHSHLGNPGLNNPAVGNPGINNPSLNNPGPTNPGLNNGTTNSSWVAPPSNQPNPQGNNQLPHGGGNPNDRKPFVPGPGPLPPGLRPNPNDARGTGRGSGTPGGAARGGPGSGAPGGTGRGGPGGGGTGAGAGGRGPTPGGFGAGSAGPAGRGSFGPSNPGGAAGVAHGPEGTTRGGSGAAGPGRTGAAGAGGMGGVGAGASNGEEDKEHKSNYLVPTDDYFDDDRMVAPPVIGG
ncbi:hypothetical protein GCM10011609_68230 [Lentzea pudingi]|uniref:PPE family protein n=1 Tax=Lentzea pudingi TaxID=1789439 RepID=A0ABQ2IRC8_9PSEU|nr:hypothetical protein [Lentzea pudingi]GGN17655.1 hypothetical protein GCM10011609_68230 [Lentzea pudingi]